MLAGKLLLAVIGVACINTSTQGSQVKRALPTIPQTSIEGKNCWCLKMDSMKKKLAISCDRPTLSQYGKLAHEAYKDPCNVQ